MHEQPLIGQLVFNEREIMVRHFRHFGFQRCRSFGPIRINFRSTDLTEEDMNGRCDIHVKGLHVSKGENGLQWRKSSLWKAHATERSAELRVGKECVRR